MTKDRSSEKNFKISCVFAVCVINHQVHFSDFDGLLRLQRIYKSIPKNEYGTYSFQVDIVKRIDTADDAIEFLLELEKINRNSLKRVILDCSSQKAKVRMVSQFPQGKLIC